MSNFEYVEVVRKPNPMAKINPLAKASESVVSLGNRIDQLENHFAWKKNIKNWVKSGDMIDLSLLPKVTKIRLGDILIDEDIQRTLDEKHCANTIGAYGKFDPRLCQPAYCIKTSKGEFRSCDAQHTYSTIASLINAGLVVGVTDWRDFEIIVIYIETDDMSFARKAFGIINGKGKKKQSVYQNLKTSVFCVRIDGNTDDEDDVVMERKLQIAEANNCYPVEEKSNLLKYAGTFSHISAFLDCSESELKVALKWHDDYFHFTNVHASTFYIFSDLVRTYESFRKPITDKMLLELAGMIQSWFGGLEEFGQGAMRAYKEWSIKRYGYEVNWKRDAYACALMQLYVKMGGTEQVPEPLLDKYTDLVEFMDADILQAAA